ncbi:MAG: hypothetical protein JW910_00825 [Anaerolineae bacterium]|nr:hypothetical protein [Anaerolineae bacterium]
MDEQPEDNAAQMNRAMDPHLLEFIRLHANSFLKWDLMRFFHDNPHTVDTVANIARYTGRDTRTVAPELQELAESGVLDVDDVGDLIAYMLTTDAAMRDLIGYFVAACEDRDFRVMAVYHVIQAKQ